MTYCLALCVGEGIAFAADTRSNAGVDYVSSYRKLHRFKTGPNNVVALLAAGSLATTQEVVSTLRRDLLSNGNESFNSHRHLFEMAGYVGRVSRAVQRTHAESLNSSGVSGEATFIMGGQIRGEPPGIYMIYPQGNFIEASDDTPYLQIGESKYGKPVLDRFASRDLSLDQAVRLAVLSLNATVQSNVTVGTPLDLGIYHADSLQPLVTGRLDEADEYYVQINEAWNRALKNAFLELPSFRWPNVEHEHLEIP